MPKLSDYFAPKQFAFTPDKSAAIATGNEGQKFVSQSYDPTVNTLQSIGPAWWDYVGYTLDKSGQPRTAFEPMLKDMLSKYGNVTADTTAPEWFMQGQRYDYFNPQTTPTATTPKVGGPPSTTANVGASDSPKTTIPDVFKAQTGIPKTTMGTIADSFANMFGQGAAAGAQAQPGNKVPTFPTYQKPNKFNEKSWLRQFFDF